MIYWIRTSRTYLNSWRIVCDNLVRGFKNMKQDVSNDPIMPKEEFVEIWCDAPENIRWSHESIFNIMYTLSEARSFATNSRDTIINNAKKADLIICPSNSATIAFVESPIDKPIVVIPFGVDTEKFKYKTRQWNGIFTFLLAGVAQIRKGTWLALEAFHKISRQMPASRMIIWSSTVQPIWSDLIDIYKHPKITFSTDKLESACDIYYDAHVLISPHLSEGFGMTIPEAMSTGMPCIVSRCSAPLDFFSSKAGWFIEMSDYYMPISDSLPMVNGSWRLPDIASLAEKMLYAYRHRRNCRAKGKWASQYINESLTWDITAKNILSNVSGRRN